MQKLTKSQLKRNIVYTWYTYPLVILASTIGWIWAFEIFHQPSTHQRITIFAGAVLTDDSINGLLKKKYSDEQCRLVETASISTSNSQYASKLNLYLNNADLLILPEKTLNGFDGYYDGFFYPIDSYVKSYLNSTYSFFSSSDSIDYGVQIREKNRDSWLKEYFALEEDMDYYIVLAASGQNAGKLGGDNNASYDNALTALNYLLEGF